MRIELDLLLEDVLAVDRRQVALVPCIMVEIVRRPIPSDRKPTIVLVRVGAIKNGSVSVIRSDVGCDVNVHIATFCSGRDIDGIGEKYGSTRDISAKIKVHTEITDFHLGYFVLIDTNEGECGGTSADFRVDIVAGSVLSQSIIEARASGILDGEDGTDGGVGSRLGANIDILETTDCRE